MASTNPTSVTVNGITITTADVARFAPIVHSYPTETYTPCTIEWLLQGSTWFQVPVVGGNPVWTDPGTQLNEQPTPANLGALPGNGAAVKVVVQPSQFPGQGWTAPMYVAPQVPADQSYVELTFVFLYAYNGPQSVELQLSGSWAKCVAPQYAEHQGDIESITMRVDPSLKTVQYVRFEAHGTSTWFAPSEVEMQGTQAVVGCALNSHASYNVMGQNGPYSVMLDENSVEGYGLNIVDFVDPNGPVWQPSEYIFIGVENGAAQFGQAWANFNGRLGDCLTNGYATVYGADGELTTAQQTIGDAISQLALKAGKIPSEDLEGWGPGGLFGRGFINILNPVGYQASSLVVLRCLQRLYLALDINDARPNGPLQVSVFDESEEQSWNQVFVGEYFYLVNSVTNLIASNPTDNSAVIQIAGPVDSTCFWYQESDGGIRSNRNPKMYLNVEAGNNIPQAGAGVCVWNWGGGHANEVWTVGAAEAIIWPISEGQVYLKTTQRPLYLTQGASSGQLTVELANYSTDGTTNPQLWNAVDYGCGTAFVNAMTGLALSGPNDDAPVVEVDPGAASDSSVWTIANVAIRPLRNSDVNLNVEAGNNVPQAGAGICVWEWGKGKPNETWALVNPANMVAPAQVYVRCKTLPYVLQPNAANSAVLVQNLMPGQANQIWLQANLENGYFTLQHQQTGLYLVAPSSRRAVLLGNGSNFNDAYLWKQSSGGAIPVWENDSLNLNVEAGNNQPSVGATVCVWNWGGGQPNELWVIEAV